MICLSRTKTTMEAPKIRHTPDIAGKSNGYNTSVHITLCDEVVCMTIAMHSNRTN
jgi:hypothetical protein